MYASSLNVLLVEDSQLLADRLRESILMVPGIDLVATVDSEAAALRALNARPIDVVVVDLHLQGGTGFGVLRALGADQGRRGIVPIVLTNHDLGEYRRAAMALGARHFLDKLRDFDLLPQLLEQIALEPSRPCGRSAVS